MANDLDDTQTPQLPNRAPEDVLSTQPPVKAESPRVTLTIDLGSLTPDTVAAIQAFVAALAKDPAKGASTGPLPGVPWPSALPRNQDSR